MIQEDRSRWRRGITAGGLVAIFCVVIFAFPHVARAEVWADVREGLLNLLGYILLAIATVLGKLVMIVVNGLIGVAQYNEFVSSQPVTIGWPLVRDVVNMFFIVVLLVVAFSTIIGYEHFHYKKVLPKLLLMAILINFSKTLLGLLIDFSQVLVLTFVTAFKQAAAGNFVTALKLDKIFTLVKDGSQNPADILGSIFLGVILLGVMLSAVLIMLAFMVFRVVGLWILLIMSPIAFFALALPDKMKKGMDPFTSKFWGQLTTLLIAGPAMAFFLWLALAIASGPSPFKIGDSVELSDAAKESTNGINFSSAVGNPADITTFVVAVMLMLQGVEFGLSAAKDISPGLGAALGKYVTPQGLARGAGRISYTAGKYGLKAGWGVTKFAAKTTGKTLAGAAGGVDTLTKGWFSRGIGKGLQAVAQRAPGNIGMKAAASLQGRFGRIVKEKGEKYDALTKGLSAEQSMKFLNSQGSWITPAAQTAATARKGEIAMSSAYLDASKARIMKQKKLSGPDGELIAEGLAAQDARGYVQASYAMAKKNNDGEAIKRLEEKIKADPRLMDFKGLSDVVDKNTLSPKELAHKTNDKAFSSALSAAAHAQAMGMIDANGNEIGDSDALKIVNQSGGLRKAKYDAFMQNTTLDQRKTLLDSLKTGASKEQVEAAINADPYFGRSGKNVIAVSLATGKVVEAGGAFGPERNIRVNVENERAQGMSMLKEAERQGPAVYYGAPGDNARNRMVAGGVNLAPVFNYNIASGEFAKVEDRGAFASSMTQIMDKTASGDKDAADALVKMDISVLKDSSAGSNEMRSVFAAQLDPMALSVAFKNAKDAGNVEMQKKLAEMADIVRQEAAQTNKIIAKAKVGTADLERLSSGEDFAGKQAIVAKLADAGAGNETRALAAARAAVTARIINDSEQFRDLRGVVGRRAQRATQNRRQTRVDDDDDVT